MARKKTGPWSPAAHHGITPETLENHWKNNVLPHGRGGIGSGAIGATWQILWFSKNLGKALEKQGFGQEHQMARKKTDRHTIPTTYLQACPKNSLRHQTMRKPLEKQAKSRGSLQGVRAQCGHPFPANLRWQEKNNPEFDAPGPADSSTFRVIWTSFSI